MATSSRHVQTSPPVFAVLAMTMMGILALGVAACNDQESSRSSAIQEVNLKSVIIPIEGMSCSACAARVKQALTSIDGVADVEVDLAERNARVQFTPSKLSPDRLVSAVNGLGYRASRPTEAP